MNPTHSRLFQVTAAAVLASFLSSSLPAWSQPSDADKITARALGEEGQAALDKKDYATALDKFSRADKLFHAPTLLLGVAQSLAGQNKLVSALEAYNRVVREGAPAGAPQAFRDAVEFAKKEAQEIQPKIPAVIINVDGHKEPTVTIDGDLVPTAALGVKRFVDPGKHQVKASAAGFVDDVQQIDIKEKQTLEVKLSLKPSGAPKPMASMSAAAPPPAPTTTGENNGRTWQRPAAYGALGVGGVGIIVGAITGGIALGKKSDLNDKCTLPNNACPASESDTLDSFRTMRTVSTVSFVVGAVGIGAGVALLLTAPKKNTTQAFVSPYVGPNSFGVVGGFLRGALVVASMGDVDSCNTELLG